MECARRNCHWNPAPEHNEYYCTFVSTSYTYDVLQKEASEKSFEFVTYSTDPNENLYGSPYQNTKFTADLSQILNSDQVDFRLQMLAGTTNLGEKSGNMKNPKNSKTSPNCVASGTLNMCFDDTAAYQNVYWSRTSEENGRVLDLSNNPVIIEEQYIQFTMSFEAGTKFFGLGEQVHPTVFSKNCVRHPDLVIFGILVLKKVKFWAKNRYFKTAP